MAKCYSARRGLWMCLVFAAAMTARAEVPKASAPRVPKLSPQKSGTTSRLQAVSVVSGSVVWASGTGGTFAVTTNGGTSWRSGVVPGTEGLQFRDVQGISAKVAYLLAAGAGPNSRVFRTDDGGSTWALQLTNQEPSGFFDCFAFFSPKRGLLMTDSVKGRFPMMRTTDGATWADVGDRMPPALPGEAAFAASGTCIATHGGKWAWVATGGAKARVLSTDDSGKTWTAAEAPVGGQAESAGGISIAFRDAQHGVLGGGGLDTADSSKTFARSGDGGKSWQLGAPTPFPGPVYGITYACGRTPEARFDDPRHEGDEPKADCSRSRVVATGPGGTAWSGDEGASWKMVEEVDGYWSVGFANPSTGWLVGTEGRILRMDF